MAKEYLDKLNALINETNIENEIDAIIGAKHFFSGAGLYKNETMCVSLSPVGLAFKLPETEVAKLLDSGNAIPLKYFPKGHIKKGYALFERPDLTKKKLWKQYLLKALK